jgi:dihydroxyacetone kinase-like protein
MTITPSQLSDLISHLHQRALASEQALNAADARLGDGDTGSMLLRIIKAMYETDLTVAVNLAAAAEMLAKVTMTNTGSSLGTLSATALLSLAKQAKANGGDIEAHEVAQVLRTIRDAVLARGGASLGDKTVIDSVEAIAEKLDCGPVGRRAAARAAAAALEAFRDRPCRIGRARMFPEKSKGADDPGMLAVALLLDDEEQKK